MCLGANLIPEGLETGEMIINDTEDIDRLEQVYIIAFTGDKYGDTDISQNGFSYNGIWSSVTFFVTNILQVGLQIINNAGQGDKILTVFSIPKLAVWDFIPHNTEEQSNYYCLPIEENYMQQAFIKTLNNRPNTVDNYTPINKKLLTYPYIYLGFTPQNGSKNIYRFENFTNNIPSFKIISEINPNPTVLFIPQNYLNENENTNNLASLNGYPNISYKNDYFNTWLAQNSEIITLNANQEQFNYEVGLLQNTSNSLSSMISKASQGDLSSLLDASNLGFNIAKQDINHEYYIKNMLAQIEKQKLLPDNATLSGSNATLLGYNLIQKNIFTVYSIKQQFAKRIDNFFSMYGYLTNELKIPNLNNRPNWNYIKTIGINIIGYIPQEDLQEIKLMFDNGVTLWHNTNTFLDYSQNNK